MNVRECHELCCDTGLYDSRFSTRDMLVSFVLVNLDDDLYYQEEVQLALPS